MIKLELSEQMMNVISIALGEQPAKLVHTTLIEIQRQIDEQQQNKSELNGGEKHERRSLHQP